MIAITISVSVMVSLGVCALFMRRWRRKMREEIEADAIIGSLRREVGEMVTELNGTAERNIALLEDRISALNELLDRAGKTSGVLRRESEKHDLASQVYTSLERSRPMKTLNLSIVEGGAIEGNGAGGPESSSSGSEGQGRPYGQDSGGAARSGGDSGPEGSGTGALQGGDFIDPATLGPRDRALVLHRNGVDPESIAAELGMSRGEVELIISIHDRRNR